MFATSNCPVTRAPNFGAENPFAEVAELVDALASGASGGNPVEVQVLSSVPFPDFKTIWFRPRALAS
jgi:hypothetical protein